MKGLFTALVTPFTEDGEDINWPIFDLLLERQVQASVSGIVLFGTTGESVTITQKERNELISRAQKIMKRKVLLLAGCGTSSTKTTLEQVQEATKLGCDAIQLVTPAYNKPTQEGLIAHIRAVHDATHLPIFLYNMPGRTAVNIEPKTLMKLTDLKRIVGIKEASGNMQQLIDIMAYKPKISILSGDDLLLLPMTALGASGLTSVISNLIPHTMQKLMTLCLEGNFTEAKKIFYKLQPLMQGCFLETNPAPIKFLLNTRGYNVGPCRLPLAPLETKTVEALKELLRITEIEEIS